MWIVTVIIGFLILGLTHSKIGDIVGIAVVVIGFAMAAMYEGDKWRGE